MKSEFEKARDEAFPVLEGNVGDHPLNHYRREGADWAYEWCRKQMYSDMVNNYMSLTKEAEALRKELQETRDEATALAEALENLRPLKSAIHMKTGTEVIDEALARWRKFNSGENDE